MELFDTTQLGLEAAIRGSAARQQAIAQNIANVNTPGYRRQDVDFASTLQGALAEDDRTGLDSFLPQPAADLSASAVRVDGNTVDIDRESATQASNGLLYQSLVSVARARIDILEAAMGR